MGYDTTKDFYSFLNASKEKAGIQPKKVHSADDYELPPPKPRPQRRVVEEYEPPKKVVQPQPRPVQQPVQRMPRQLNEAYTMIEAMKKRIEDIFYNYGIIGLQRLDEALDDVIEEIMNPEPIVKTIEVPVQQPVKKIKRKRIRKPVVKEIVEKDEVEEVPEEEYIEEDPRKALNMANLNMDELSAILETQDKSPKKKSKDQEKTEAMLSHYQSEMDAMQEAAEQAEENDEPENNIVDEAAEIDISEEEVNEEEQEAEEQQ